MSRLPVLYVGWQEGFREPGVMGWIEVPGFHLVDESSGSTKAYRPDIHVIVGLSDTARRRGVIIPAELTADEGLQPEQDGRRE
jgi:hypothetical protein